MNDTNPAVDSQFRQLMMTKSQEERLLMGCSMYDAAKQIVESALFNQNPGITPQKIREKIFLRFYGAEFNRAEKKKILNSLKRAVKHK